VHKSRGLPYNPSEPSRLVMPMEQKKSTQKRNQLLSAALDVFSTYGFSGASLDLVAGRAAQVFDRTIDNQISRLRRKIERDPTRPEIITTVRGGGYCLSVDVKELT